MLKITHILETPRDTNLVLELPFELRQKSRLKTQLTDGTDVGLELPRGKVLRGGDCVADDEGNVIRIEAAKEQVSRVYHDDSLMLTKAAYHLGNRHVALQVDQHGLSYLHDHVLDDMVRNMGLTVTVEMAPFEPEAGAYSGGGHSHSHGHHHEHHHHH